MEQIGPGRRVPASGRILPQARRRQWALSRRPDFSKAAVRPTFAEAPRRCEASPSGRDSGCSEAVTPNFFLRLHIFNCEPAERKKALLLCATIGRGHEEHVEEYSPTGLNCERKHRVGYSRLRRRFAKQSSASRRQRGPVAEV